MSRIYRHSNTKKPAALSGCGLAADAKKYMRPSAFEALLHLHSVFLRRRLLLGQAVDIATPQ
jgi:hypothetical protein